MNPLSLCPPPSRHRATPRAWLGAAGLCWALGLLPGHAAAQAAPQPPAAPPAASPTAAALPDGTTLVRASTSSTQSGQAPDVLAYDEREDVQRWADEAAPRLGLHADWMLDQLARARYQPKVAQLIMPAPTGTAKNWRAYRARFVEPLRIREGVRWWNENERWLSAAEVRWGVPAAVVAAIVGVETYYGRMQGTFRVLDALATLAFDFPSGRSDRRPFFRDELAQFLAWCHKEQRDPQSVRGSYAGAIGMPQFMPSSLMKYAVDFNKDGHIDLQTQGADVVGSVAHYLAEFGWQPGLPTHFEVEPPVDEQQRALLQSHDVLPTFSAAQMRENGALLTREGLNHPGPLALVELQNGQDAPLYVATTQNFYTITRYNWSAYYAMAVIELARELRQEHDKPAAPPPRRRPVR